MARILVIIGIIAALAGAVFTFMIQQKATDTAAELEDVAAQAQTAQDEAAQLKTDVAAKEQALTEAQEKVTSLEEEIKKTQDELTSAKSELTAANTKAEDANTKLASLETEFKEYKETYSPEQIDKLSTQVTDLNDKLATLETEKTQAEERVGELETLLAEANTQPASGEPSADGQPATAAAGPAASGISGRVQAVNQGWNFVVVNLGEADGITPNTRFDVYREGSKVATLRVSTVEPKVSTADVVTNRKGIQPGDQVVTARPSA